MPCCSLIAVTAGHRDLLLAVGRVPGQERSEERRMAFAGSRGADNLNERLRLGMRASAISVWLVSTSDASGAPYGLAVTNASTLTASPPSIMVSISRKASSYPVLMRKRAFCLNMIHSGQIEMLDHFGQSARRDHRFVSPEWKNSECGLPYLETAMANLLCSVDEMHDYGDHTVIFGRIYDVRTSPAASELEPLIWINGGPARLDRGDHFSSFIRAKKSREIASSIDAQ